MRIWSLHPKYLDTKGLVALWRETLLAKHVLEGKTKGYKHHPQLKRFKAKEESLHAINHYLSEVFFEARDRGYNFDRLKVDWKFIPQTIKVTRGQLIYEFEHLKRKLATRDHKKLNEVTNIVFPDVHSTFQLVDGAIEDWEIT